MRNTAARTSIVTTASLLLFAGQLLGQAAPPGIKTHAVTASEQKTCEDIGFTRQTCVQLGIVGERGAAADTDAAIKTLDDPSIDLITLADSLRGLVLARQFQSALQQVATNGNVNQNGSTAGTSGATNLVTKPTTTSFLSVASEAGAFTDTVNGSTATIQANALGLVKYLNGVPVFGHWQAAGAEALHPLNFNATLGITQSGSTTAATSGTATSPSLASLASVFIPTNDATLQSFGATYAIRPKFNPNSQTAVDAWNKAVIGSATLQAETVAMATAIGKLIPASFYTSASLGGALAQWERSAAEDASNFEALANDYNTYLKVYRNAVLEQTNGLANATIYLNATNAFEAGVDTLVDQARGVPIATFGYTYTPSAQKPATHTFTASLAYTFQKKSVTAAGTKATTTTKSDTFFHTSGMQITGNASVVLFAKVPASASYGRLQDYQASAEFDVPMGKDTLNPVATFSVAGYGQYQYNPTVLNITTANLLPGTNISLPANAQSYLGAAGWLEVAQAKIVVNLKQGLTLPVAVKWSSNTDLLNDANEVRGQIGLSYDLSALQSLIKGAL